MVVGWQWAALPDRSRTGVQQPLHIGRSVHGVSSRLRQPENLAGDQFGVLEYYNWCDRFCEPVLANCDTQGSSGNRVSQF